MIEYIFSLVFLAIAIAILLVLFYQLCKSDVLTTPGYYTPLNKWSLCCWATRPKNSSFDSIDALKSFTKDEAARRRETYIKKMNRNTERYEKITLKKLKSVP